MKNSGININHLITMKAFRIVALLFIMGASQAGATGFAHNMNKAQKMLKTKKEVVLNSKTLKAETPVKSEARKADAREVVNLERGASLTEVEEPLSERVVGTFTHWFSQTMMKVLTVWVGR